MEVMMMMKVAGDEENGGYDHENDEDDHLPA